MKACKRCGKPITFAQDWLGRWVVLDVRPPEWRRESYVEIEREHFVSVFRHVCEVEIRNRKDDFGK